MIKKLISLTLSIAMLSACSGLISPLDSGDSMPKKEAVLVGKINLSPMLDDDGDLTKKTNDDYLPAFMYFSSDKTDVKSGEGYQAFDEVETNKFFAIPIGVEQDLKLAEMQFSIERSSWFSNTEHIYHTRLSKIQFPIDHKAMKAGEVYYMGTIHIDLAKQSFKETGDEEYDEEEAHYIVPLNISLSASDSAAAKAWFNNEFPKAGKTVKPLKVSVTANGEDNKFNHTQITTTYR